MFFRLNFVRIFFLSAVCLSAVFLVGFVPDTADLSLSLKDVLRTAILNRADFQVNLKEIERMEAESERGKAALFAPKIRFDINRERTFAEGAAVGGDYISREGLESSYRRTLSGGGDLVLGYGQANGLFGTPDVVTPERLFISYTGALNGKSEDFLRSEYNIEQAFKEKHKAVLAYGVAYQQLVLEIAQLYFSAFQAQNALETERSMLVQRRKLLRAARKRLELGVGSRVDLLRAEVETVSREERVLAAENVAVNAVRLLMNRAGRMSEFSENKIPKLSGELNPGAISFDNSYYISRALENRQELKIAMIDVEISRAELEMVRELRKRKPVVSGYLERNTAHTDFSPFAAHRGDYRLGLSYEIPLGDRERLNEEAALEAELEKRKLLLMDLRERITLAVETALGNIKSATERLLLLEKNWEQAKESVKLSESAYLKGVATPLDLINAQDALLSTERIIVDAAAQRKMAEFQLLREVALFPADIEEIDEMILLARQQDKIAAGDLLRRPPGGG
jgi:outer membrane protein TolC